MKTKILGLLFSTAFSAMAAITGTNAFDLQSVVATTATGQAILFTNANLPARTYLVQHTGITGQVSSVSGTNSLKVNIQFSLDNTNWTTVATYVPARTNATVDAFTPNVSRVNVYMRTQVVTTNTVTTGVTTVAQ